MDLSAPWPLKLSRASNKKLRGAPEAPASTVRNWLNLQHSLTFAPGQGWVDFLPQFGWGALGGWVAVLFYVIVLGTTLFLRWRSAAWQKFRL